MAITLEAFGIDQLSTEDRVELARLIMASVDAEPLCAPAAPPAPDTLADRLGAGEDSDEAAAGPHSPER